ncbi:putative dehydrogenase [Ereboglobus sp. PH5-10]|uniref:Gfo/Idh/MocA family protein n=1 Tax=Ereboglobus sp. PH5-10 TaxID=2940629 RepID=UPI00240758C1|nr:Gfo/Idh/MocA family oxidoreductase [Ereboglobus sp. PH5-10]MDF9828218.1 putative dehydrogenase [Ereboglobus sp. PH5-10]
MSTPSQNTALPKTVIDRRTFAKTAALAGAGLAMGSTLASVADPAPAIADASGGRRRRYAIVGCGGRHRMYLKAILNQYKDVAEIVAVCDVNKGRAESAAKSAKKAGVPIKAYYPESNPPKPDFDRLIPEFEQMIRETRPDIIIVTTTDCAHDRYIVKAMEMGCDTITEKPMTITAGKCQRILDAKKRTGKKVRVTFNYRYSPPRTQVKDILMSGAIGDILSVDFTWLLNTRHGADYFRRWHSNKINSGGLMIHKATHHFDLVNWWLSASPVEVTAVGKREFYTPAMIKRFGLKGPGERCMTCPEGDKCGFHIDLPGTPGIRTMYLDNEKYDGYMRDRCAFRPDIDIEDTMNVIVKYDTGATLSYSLNAFNAWEGYQIAFNGTKGRLEHSIVEQIYMNAADGDDKQGAIKAGGTVVRVIPLRDPATEHTPWKGTGSHGGGDIVMLNDVFLPNPPADKYQRNSDERGGAESILIGAAANMSFETGRPVKIADIVKGLKKPDYPPMPTNKDPVEMPRRLPARKPSLKKKA